MNLGEIYYWEKFKIQIYDYWALRCRSENIRNSSYKSVTEAEKLEYDLHIGES